MYREYRDGQKHGLDHRLREPYPAAGSRYPGLNFLTIPEHKKYDVKTPNVQPSFGGNDSNLCHSSSWTTLAQVGRDSGGNDAMEEFA